MPVLFNIVSRLYSHIIELKTWILFAILFGYLFISWALFFLAGEVDLTHDITNYLYFAATTASTVGYGDLSPQTAAGRLIAAFWFFPGALVIFTAVLGKLTSLLVEGVRRMADGRGNFEHVSDATVVIGYHAERTSRMIDDMIAGHDDEKVIILMATGQDINVPDGVKYVRAERLDALASLRRAGIQHARNVLVYADTDAETFNTCLAVRELNEDVHVAAYFGDRDTARRAGRLAEIETVVSNSTEVLVRAAQDPGASKVLMALSSARESSTIYSGPLSEAGSCNVTKLETQLASVHALLLAVSCEKGDDVIFRPFPETLGSEAVIYYVAGDRLASDVWDQVTESARVRSVA
ncbi:MAG: ion channel [Stappiaceae bacterium]